MTKEMEIIKKQKTVIIILSIAVVVLLGACIYLLTSKGSEKSNSGSSNTNNSSILEPSNNEKNNPLDEIPVTSSGAYKLGDTFVFDGLEITLDTTYSFTKVNNRYSDKNGSSVIKLGANVKNVSSEKKHLNMFYYDFFGSKGIELDGVSSYFDNAIDNAGDLKPGASYKAYFYILYDGDGKYSIDFDNYSEELSVEFDIVKK